MNNQGFLQTGQLTCHGTSGVEVSCPGSGQDADFKKGIPWPTPRFESKGDTVLDNLTGLTWAQNANLAEFPLTWQEALDYVSHMNTEKAFGYSDWRLPNRRELRSLISYQTKSPVLQAGHPFTNIFHGWYWTSSTAAINTKYAWYINLEGGRMFYGKKSQNYLLWPVQGEGYGILPATGQTKCFDSNGHSIPCLGSGQDGEFCFGQQWPEPRFKVCDETVIDRLTNLRWLKKADVTGMLVTWRDAFKAIETLNLNSKGKFLWRLPNINELESLVDCSIHSPALPAGHPFKKVQMGYWSSTTSMFEPDWAWALYLTKGAIGVGQKRGTYFSVWAVSDTF